MLIVWIAVHLSSKVLQSNEFRVKYCREVSKDQDSWRLLKVNVHVEERAMDKGLLSCTYMQTVRYEYEQLLVNMSAIMKHGRRC